MLPTAPRRSNVTYTLIAFACLALVLFVIAATIVLGLIPLYLSKRTVTPASLYAQQKEVKFAVPVSATVATGPLTDSERGQLSTLLESSQTAASKTRGTVKVTGASIDEDASAANNRKRRHGSTHFLIMVIVITGQNNAAVSAIEVLLKAFILNKASTIVVFIQTVVDNRSTTTTSAIDTSQTLRSTIPSGLVSTTIPSGLVSTTIPSGLVSTTIPSGLISTVAAGRRRRRRQEYHESSTGKPVTYRD